MNDDTVKLPWLDVFDRVLIWVTIGAGGLFLAFMAGFGTFNVLIMRKFANAPILGAEDLLSLALVLTVGLSIPFGGRVGAHIEIEVLETFMSKAFSRWSMFVLRLVGTILMAFMAWELVKAGGKATKFGETTQQLLISYELFYYALAFFIGLYALILLSDMVQLILRGEIRQIAFEDDDDALEQDAQS